MSAGAAAAAASQAGNGAIDRAALQKLKVAVPAAGSAEADLGLGDKPCPICQDRFKSEWSDEEEEWVWWNAVVVDKVVSPRNLSRLRLPGGSLTPGTLGIAAISALSRDVSCRDGAVPLERGDCFADLGPHFEGNDSGPRGGGGGGGRQLEKTQS